MAFSLRAFSSPILCHGNNSNTVARNSNFSHAQVATHILRAAELADKSAGFTAPHPNFGCVIATSGSGAKVVGDGYLYGQGTKPAEVQAVEAAGERCRGATAYLNMEPGDCHGDHAAVSALIQAGITRVVMGMRHPLRPLRGDALRTLRSEGVQVDVLGEDLRSKTIEVT